MIKKLAFKLSLFAFMGLLVLSFNWQTMSVQPEQLLKIAGIINLEDLKDLRNYPTKGGQTVVEVNKVLIAPFEDYQLRESYILIDRIPKSLKQAIIAIEDNRFYEHQGFDPFGIVRAVILNLQSQDYLAGGSTITQQLAKNMYLTQEKKMSRKIEELFIAKKIEEKFKKDQILEMYLNQIYFAPGIYGVGKASESFFGKDVSKLSLAEAALLAGIPKNPKSYSPTKNFKAAKERQKVVLNSMEKLGYITLKEKQEALLEELVIVK